MFGLGKHGPDGRYGAIIDIGSGSIGAAIVVSDPLEKNPQIIWTHRERMVVKPEDTFKDSSKNIAAALLNTFLEIGSAGIKKLQEHEKGARVDLVQLAFSAPWSYTITKSVSYKHEEPFEITKSLIEDLVATAEQQAMDAIDENDIVSKLGLETIVKATISVSANDYVVADPFGQDANNISVTHVSAIAQKNLLDATTDGIAKVFPKTTRERYSFMLVYYYVLQNLAPDTTEICMVDISSEATEIAIIRDGIIRYVTHAPVGMYTLARDITAATKVPTEEALAYIRGNVALEKTLTPSVQKTLNECIQSYEKEVSELLKRTGDALSIPRPIFLHADSRAETFFKAHIKNAATAATKTEHGVHLVTERLLGDTQLNDASMLISAHFFHKKYGDDKFKQA